MVASEPRRRPRAGAGEPGVVRSVGALQRLQRGKRRRVRHHGGAVDEDLGLLQEDGRIPHRAEIRQALGRIGWQNIQLDRAARTVRFDAADRNGSRRHRKRVCGRPDDRGFETAGRRPGVDQRWPVEHLRTRRAAERTARLAGDHSGSKGPSQVRGGSFSEQRIDVDLGNEREVLPGRRQSLHPHYGSPDRLPGAGHAGCVRHRAQDDRQRGVDQTLLRHGPAVGGPYTDRKSFASSCAKTDWRQHARGSNEQPLSGCLPAPADRRPAGVVHAAGGPVHEAVPGDPRQARHSGDLQAAGPGRHGDAAAGRSSGCGRGHHLRRPAAAGRADGAAAEVRRRRRADDRQPGAHVGRRRHAVDHQHGRSRLRRGVDPDGRAARWRARCR